MSPLEAYFMGVGSLYIAWLLGRVVSHLVGRWFAGYVKGAVERARRQPRGLMGMSDADREADLDAYLAKARAPQPAKEAAK